MLTGEMTEDVPVLYRVGCHHTSHGTDPHTQLSRLSIPDCSITDDTSALLVYHNSAWYIIVYQTYLDNFLSPVAGTVHQYCTVLYCTVPCDESDHLCLPELLLLCDSSQPAGFSVSLGLTNKVWTLHNKDNSAARSGTQATIRASSWTWWSHTSHSALGFFAHQKGQLSSLSKAFSPSSSSSSWSSTFPNVILPGPGQAECRIVSHGMNTGAGLCLQTSLAINGQASHGHLTVPHLNG